jgi:hypothetical protein
MAISRIVVFHPLPEFLSWRELKIDGFLGGLPQFNLFPYDLFLHGESVTSPVLSETGYTFFTSICVTAVNFEQGNTNDERSHADPVAFRSGARWCF